MTLIVNGEKIEDALIQQEAEHMRTSYEEAFKDMAPEQREAQLLDWSKENLIERVLIRQEAKANGDKTHEADVETAKIFKLPVREEIARAKYIPQAEVEKVAKIRDTISEQMKQLQTSAA